MRKKAFIFLVCMTMLCGCTNKDLEKELTNANIKIQQLETQNEELKNTNEELNIKNKEYEERINELESSESFEPQSNKQDISNETIIVSKDNPNPVVYEIDETKITISCERKNGSQSGYRVLFFIENNSETDLTASLINVYVNDYKISSYTDMTTIAPGKKGTATSTIYDKDLEENGITEIENIECEFSVGEGVFNSFYSCPGMIKSDAFVIE